MIPNKKSNPLVTPLSPLDWTTANATIVHPVLGRIPFVPYPYQAEFLRDTARRRLVLKARQIGYSQAFALEALYKVIHFAERTILLVSRSQDLAVNLLRYCYQAYNSLKVAPQLIKENESEMGLANGSRIKSIPANRSTGRGFAASDVYLDEFAYAAYADSIYQSVTPALAQGGTLTIASTPNGMGNKFHELWLSGEAFSRQRIDWTQCPTYWTPQEKEAGISATQSAWYLDNRPNYSAQAWAAEYDCDFSISGGLVFTQDAIERGPAGAIGDASPVANHRYLTSVDVGRRHDPTVINVFDLSVAPVQRVYHERLVRVPYPVSQRKVADVWRMFGGVVAVESNGVGDPFIENLDIPMDKLLPFTTTQKTKTQAIQSLVLLLEQDRLKARWTPQERNELTFYQWDDKALVQDCVMSLAIGAWHIVDRSRSTDWSSIAGLGHVDDYRSKWK